MSAVCVAHGAAVWAASPLVFGKPEPWDASFGLYIVAITLGGLWALLSPRAFWAAPAGLVVGQVGYMLVFLPASGLAPLGVVMVSVLAVPAAGLAGLIFMKYGRARIPFGTCTECGYDLSGTPTAETCPECGARSRARA